MWRRGRLASYFGELWQEVGRTGLRRCERPAGWCSTGDSQHPACPSPTSLELDRQALDAAVDNGGRPLMDAAAAGRKGHSTVQLHPALARVLHPASETVAGRGWAGGPQHVSARLNGSTELHRSRRQLAPARPWANSLGRHAQLGAARSKDAHALPILDALCILHRQALAACRRSSGDARQPRVLAAAALGAAHKLDEGGSAARPVDDDTCGPLLRQRASGEHGRRAAGEPGTATNTCLLPPASPTHPSAAQDDARLAHNQRARDAKCALWQADDAAPIQCRLQSRRGVGLAVTLGAPARAGLVEGQRGVAVCRRAAGMRRQGVRSCDAAGLRLPHRSCVHDEQQAAHAPSQPANGQAATAGAQLLGRAADARPHRFTSGSALAQPTTATRSTASAEIARLRALGRRIQRAVGGRLSDGLSPKAAARPPVPAAGSEK